MDTVETAIKIDKLSKRYKKTDRLALDKLSLEVMPGEIYGFLGPNGAGKSTTIRLLLNFIQPTEGSAVILGKDIAKDSVEIKRSIGYLAGDVALYPKMTGREFLDYMADLQPPKKAGFRAELIKRFKAQPNVKIANLSKGNKQKIGLIQAFMHEPDVLILDEPTSGLDPLMQEEFFKLLDESKSRGASVFFSSHNLAEVQKICDRVGFVREGRLIAEQTIADVAAVAARTFDITFSDEPSKTELKAIPGAKVSMTSPRQASIRMSGDLAPMFRVLARHKVVAINQRELNLETEFLHFYKEEKK
jgi:ABC-2 type transport system ATP-binding protein